MEVYCVGGAPRDVLLNRSVHDLDYVVIGATHDDMINQGFSVVGSGFPVYLHQRTGNEYALGRTETKVGVGYNGFETNTEHVSLIQDLSRRDLRCNALAVRVEDWDTFVATKDTSLVLDYFGGISDLKSGILCHINEDFGLDPVRVLRTARFAARYGFDIHPDTIELMRKVAPELDYIPQERIWTEFEKGLMEDSPWIMVERLHECMAMCTAALRPYVSADAAMMRFIIPSTPLYVRSALLTKGFCDADYDTCRVPTSLSRISKAVNKHGDKLWYYVISNNKERLKTLELFRALSDSTFIYQCTEVLGVHLTGITSETALHRQVRWDLDNISKVDASAIASACKNGLEIKQMLFESRVASM